jgi:hypothetical protein
MSLFPADPYFDNVVLLVPCDGENGDTTTPDFSNEKHTMTFAANASLDSSERKFGSTSCLIDNTDGKGVYTPTSAAWANLKIADGFTVEAHVNYSVTGTNTLVSMWSWTQGSTTRSWGIFLGSDGGVDVWTQNSASSATHSFGSATGLLTADTWHHVVFQCQPAGNFEVFVDGTRVVNVAPSISELRDPTDDFCIGATDDSVDELDGYVENVRITKGVARYTGNFRPPRGPYPARGIATDNPVRPGDPYFNSVSLLVPFDGENGDTTSTDLSNSAHTLTFGGTAALDGDIRKFGVTSLILDGDSDYVDVPTSTEFDFGTGTSTIEFG